MLFLLLAACDRDKPTDPFTCGEGEIRTRGSGELHATLADALNGVLQEDTICVGPGTFDLASTLDCRNPTPVDDFRALTVVGAGSEQTRLVGRAGDARAAACRDLQLSFWEPTDRLTVEGLTFENAEVYVSAGVVEARDLRVEGYAGTRDTALNLAASASLEVEGVALSDNHVPGGGGFHFLTQGEGTVRDVAVVGNTFANGYFGAFHGNGALAVEGLVVTDNVRTTKDPGFDFVELFDTVTVRDATFSGNRTNGAALGVFGDAVVEDATFEENQGSWRSVVHAYGESTLALDGARFVDNVGADAAVGVYDAARVTLEDAAFVDNAPCDVLAGTCLTGLGEGVTLTCDGEGCR